jgi:hypothetical protein
MTMNVTEEIGAPKHEGRTTRAIERQTSKIPSAAYLSLAVGSMALSAAILLRPKARMVRRVMGDSSGLANFIGQWAPTLLVIGLYNKIVKLEQELIGER